MTDASGSGLRGRALGVMLGAFAAQVGLGLSYIRAPLFKDIIAEFGWSRGEFAAAAAVTNFAVAGLSPLIGWLTATFGARAVVSLSLLWTGVLFGLFSQMQSYGELVALHVGMGFMVAGVGDIAVGSAVASWMAARRGLALGLVYSGSNVGGLLVSIAVPAVLARGGSWRDAFLWTGGAALFVLLPLAALGLRNPPAAAPAPPRARAAAPQPAAAADAAGHSLRDAMRTREFWLLWGALFAFYFYYLGVQPHLVAYFTDLGIAADAASYSYGATVAIGVVAKLGIGVIGDRWPARAALVLNFGMLCAGSLLLLAVGAAPGLLPAYLLVHGLAVAAQNVTYPLIVAHCFGARRLAQIYGVLMLALAPGGGLGSTFAGYVFDWTGSYRSAFQIFALLNAAALVAVLLLRPRERLALLSPPQPR